jgi:hypothetical protein
MRLTRDTLIKIARDTAEQRARVSRRIICIYMTGSVMEESPLLGGTTDIDLVVIHDSDPIQPREIVRLTDEIHLDFAHYSQSIFHQPRHLRSDPWLGPFIYGKPMVLYETGHWFDFIQAASGAQFFQPDYVLQRAGALSQAARQSWLRLAAGDSRSHPARVYAYFEALENAGNALVSLTGEGKPLAERRFLLQLPQRLQALHQPDLLPGLTSLVVADPSKLEGVWSGWLAGWKAAILAAGAQADVHPRLNPARQLYYERAINAMWEENPDAAAWLLLRTWSLAADYLPADSMERQAWAAALDVLELDQDRFDARLAKLDRYLDRVEEVLDTWGSSNGAAPSSTIS